MSTKRIVLIIMCGLLVLMAVLMVVVFSKFMPFLALLRPKSDPVIQAPSTTATVPTQPPVTTLPKPTLPTQPPIITEPGHVHDFQFSQLVAPTCESPGYSLYTCSCNMLDMRDMKDPLGHTYGTGKKVVLCEEEGYTEYICTVCQYADRQNFTEAPGHNYELIETVDPSCAEDGYELMRCDRCEDEKQDNIVPALGHADFDWIESRAPGVGEPGEEIRQCSVCEHRESRECVMSVMRVDSEDQGDRMEHTVYVGTNNTPQALTYFIKDYSKTSWDIKYTSEGLRIKALSTQILLEPLENDYVIIDGDGRPAGGIPTVPTTGPSTSTGTQPTEPDTSTGTQPTVPGGTTVTQPTVPSTPTGTQPDAPGTSTGTQPTLPGTSTGTQPTVPSPEESE